MSGQFGVPEAAERPASIDDQATQREAEFTAAALAACRQGAPGGRPGNCSNCGEQLASLAIYCDADCRADHERRLMADRRRGGRSA